jgi:hypothetical protein
MAGIQLIDSGSRGYGGTILERYLCGSDLLKRMLWKTRLTCIIVDNSFCLRLIEESG